MKHAALLLTISAAIFPANSSMGQELSDFVDANATHTILHEIGHALIDQFQLPVIGQEEDAVDAFATIEVMNLMEEYSKDILTDVATNWLYMDAQTDRGDLDFYDTHDLDAQRAYRTICHLYGLNPEENSDVAEWADLPEDILEVCEETGPLAYDSWETLLSGIVRDESEPITPISVEFGPSEHTDTREALIASGLLDDFADYAKLSFAWPEPLSFVAADCGEPNAFWDPEALTVTLCYEILLDWAEIEESIAAE